MKFCLHSKRSPLYMKAFIVYASPDFALGVYVNVISFSDVFII